MLLLFFVFDLVLPYLSIVVFFFLGDDADLESEVVFSALVVVSHLLHSCLQLLSCFLLAQHFTDSLAKRFLLRLLDPAGPIGHRGLAILQL